MRDILIVSPSDSITQFLGESSPPDFKQNLLTVRTCGEARRILLERQFDLCIINSPLSDEYGDKLAITVIGEKVNQVILIAKQETLDEISEKVEEYGVFTLGKPFSRSTFWMVYKMAESSFRRLDRMKNENDKLKRMLNDMKLVSKAKCLLVEFEKMSEEDAHRFIEQSAMNERKTRGEVAKEIIKKYE